MEKLPPQTNQSKSKKMQNSVRQKRRRYRTLRNRKHKHKKKPRSALTFQGFRILLPRRLNPLQRKIGTGCPKVQRYLYRRQPPMSTWVFDSFHTEMNERRQDRPGHRLIFRPWIIHPKTGERIYPKRGRFFPIWIKCDAEQLPLSGLN